MTNEFFRENIDFIRQQSLDILLQRNGNYAKGSDDALHNFTAGASIAGCTPAQAAWGYVTKHLVALRDKIQRNDFSSIDDLEEKCCDIINYTAIIYAIGIEEYNKYCNQTCKESNTVGQPIEQDPVQKLRDMVGSLRED